MSLTEQFNTNKEKEVSGVVVQYGQNEDGSIPGFHIARMSRANTRYTKMLEAATKPYRRQIELGTLSNDIAERVFLEVFVKTILRDWENVPKSDVTGEKTDTGYAPFTMENATALLTRLPDLYEDLQSQAKSASLFRDDMMESDGKN